MDRFERSLLFCHLEFNKDPFLMVSRVKMSGIGVLNFGELGICGPCGPCFFLYLLYIVVSLWGIKGETHFAHKQRKLSSRIR